MPERIHLSPPHLGGGEKAYIEEATQSNYIAPLGPQVDAFEKEIARKSRFPYTLAVVSGTAAIHLALKCIGVGPGDTVAASALTFIGGVAPIVYLGAKPVFVDSEYRSWNMDPQRLGDLLEDHGSRDELPRAVVVTDIYGQCADYDAIADICTRYGVALVIDAAESFGATYKDRFAGDAGIAAAYSFNGNKIITTSGGGMLASREPALMAYARKLSQHAKEDAPFYEHREVGFNYRMSNIAAAVGRGQLAVLEERVRLKRAVFAYYKKHLEHLDGLDFMPEAPWGTSSRWLTVMLVSPDSFGADREAIRAALEKENIEARPVWKPMHMQPVFEGCRAAGGAVAEDLFGRGLCLPSGTAMTRADMDRVIRTVVGCRGLFSG